MNKNERPAFLKGKGAAIGVVLCFVAVIMMVGSYTFNHYKKDMEQQMKGAQAEAEKLTEENSALANTDDIVSSETDTSDGEQLEIQKGTSDGQKNGQNPDASGSSGEGANQNNGTSTEGNTSADSETQSTASENTAAVWFTQESTLSWPASGATLLSYSMDHTVYFPTLEQYKYNPALIIGGTQGEEIHAAAAGIVESIEETAQTGTTVTLDMGNGYSAVYGQLTEVQAAVGDYLATGDTIGNLNAPTKYYSVEGPNLYFKVMKDGEPVDPMNFME